LIDRNRLQIEKPMYKIKIL